MDMNSKDNEATEAKPRVVKGGARKTQRRPYLQGSGNNVSLLRLERLRLEIIPRRLRRSKRLLERQGQGVAHHLKEIEGPALRHQVVSPRSQRKKVALARRQQSVGEVLTNLTSRSTAMMSELRKLFLLTDENDIMIRTQYIRSAANI